MFYKVSKFSLSGKGGRQAPLPVGKGDHMTPPVSDQFLEDSNLALN